MLSPPCRLLRGLTRLSYQAKQMPAAARCYRASLALLQTKWSLQTTLTHILLRTGRASLYPALLKGTSPCRGRSGWRGGCQPILLRTALFSSPLCCGFKTAARNSPAAVANIVPAFAKAPARPPPSALNVTLTTIDCDCDYVCVVLPVFVAEIDFGTFEQIHFTALTFCYRHFSLWKRVCYFLDQHRQMARYGRPIWLEWCPVWIVIEVPEV
jgi:hypothetical protein